MKQTAEQIVATLTAWNSKPHQASIRVQKTSFLIERAQTVLKENRKLIQQSKDLSAGISLQTEQYMDKIALFRLIVKELINQN